MNPLGVRIHGASNHILLVVYKAGDCRCRVDLFQPFRLTIDQVPVVVRVRSPMLLATCTREFNERVREAPVRLMPMRGRFSDFDNWLFHREVRP